jgi:hypothetical protein
LPSDRKELLGAGAGGMQSIRKRVRAASLWVSYAFASTLLTFGLFVFVRGLAILSGLTIEVYDKTQECRIFELNSIMSGLSTSAIGIAIITYLWFALRFQSLVSIWLLPVFVFSFSMFSMSISCGFWH